ncbi:TIGR04222 domain-containing membrane protein [Streptomyces sp. SPB074]|uniref:TIGR04222 domain-containing membrane protein n=1 Tax=Streptomyces sp. (strain SPB074) TaxID=465543 RepID=UPI0001D1E24A|nr:TIGR04222 domain-containing membrane protein [Streptomyces sp. SPB074]EFG64463.1 integral membrane protein [Streptomyces sp. SPB074]
MLWIPVLLLAAAASVVACARLFRAAVRAADPRFRLTAGRGEPGTRPLGLAETAFLVGGPGRVAEVTLVAMARRGRLLLAHTGWATAVADRPADALERAVLGALGPGLQLPVAELRAAVAGSAEVRELGERLGASRLAVPAEIRALVAGALRQLRRTVLAVAAAGLVSLVFLPHGGHSAAEVAGWFGLPLLLGAGSLVIARVDLAPYGRWATPLGAEAVRGAANHETLALAVHGLRAVHEPQFRAALTVRTAA